MVQRALPYPVALTGVLSTLLARLVVLRGEHLSRKFVPVNLVAQTMLRSTRLTDELPVVSSCINRLCRVAVLPGRALTRIRHVLLDLVVYPRVNRLRLLPLGPTNYASAGALDLRSYLVSAAVVSVMVTVTVGSNCFPSS